MIEETILNFTIAGCKNPNLNDGLITLIRTYNHNEITTKEIDLTLDDLFALEFIIQRLKKQCGVDNGE